MRREGNHPQIAALQILDIVLHVLLIDGVPWPFAGSQEPLHGQTEKHGPGLRHGIMQSADYRTDGFVEEHLGALNHTPEGGMPASADEHDSFVFYIDRQGLLRRPAEEEHLAGDRAKAGDTRGNDARFA